MRKDDPSDLKKRFFRSNDRFFQVNGRWYFSAREGEIGPFRDREQAYREAEAYAAARATGLRRNRMAETTVIPGFVYRTVLTLEEQVDRDPSLTVLDLDDD